MTGMKRWARNLEFILGAGLVGVFLLIALLCPVIAPPEQVEGTDGTLSHPAYRTVGGRKQNLPQPPSNEALLGTTGGRLDIFHALVWGVRDALRFGLTVAGAAAVLGILIGLISGYMGGWVNWLLMRITDGFLTFPLVAGIVIAKTFWQIYWTKLLGGRSPWEVLVMPTPDPILKFLLSFEFVLILFTWMPYARLTNALVLRLRNSEFIEASRALGASGWRIMLRHLLPNSLSPGIILFSRDIGAVVLIEAALTFIGFAGSSVWGTLLLQSKDWIYGFAGNPLHYWWVFVPVSLTIILFGIAWSLLGDGLNDLLNPRKLQVMV